MKFLGIRSTFQFVKFDSPKGQAVSNNRDAIHLRTCAAHISSLTVNGCFYDIITCLLIEMTLRDSFVSRISRKNYFL